MKPKSAPARAPTPSPASKRRARTSTLETVQFTLELLKRIPRTHAVTAPELCKQLADAGLTRDVRTVQRQLEELSLHFSIDRDQRSKPYGYRWKPDAQGLAIPGLNEKESLLLTLAEEHLRNLLPAEVMATMQPFFAQARTNLRPVSGERAAAQQAREWLNKVRVVSTSQPLLPPSLIPGVLDAVSTALYRNWWLDVDYHNSSDRRVSASVMPLGLAQQGTRLYLVCRFQGFRNERSLALHRILEARATQMPFKRPPEFDLAAFEDAGRFGFGHGQKISLEILIDRAAGLHLLESRLSDDQTVKTEGKKYRIRATVTDSERLVWWLRGFGQDVTVVGPASLKRRL